MLTVVEVTGDSSNADAQGEFGSSSKKICGGGVGTQSSGSRRTTEQIQWTAPADGSKKVFEVW